MSLITEPIDIGVALTAGQYTTLAGCPAASLSAVVNIRLISRDLTADVKVRLANVGEAFVDGATPPADSEWIQPLDLVLGPTGVTAGILEDSAIVLKPGRKIVAYADASKVTAHIHGFNKKAA